MPKYMNETEFVFSEEFVGFTTIPNFILNDKRVSYKALGIYVQILQYQNSPTHRIYIQGLVTRKKDGRDSVAAGIKELVTYGYLTREQLRENGKLMGMKYTVHMKPSVPMDTAENGKSVNGESDTDKPENGNNLANKHTGGRNKIGKKSNLSISPEEKEREEKEREESVRKEIEAVEYIWQESEGEHLKGQYGELLMDEIKLNMLDMYTKAYTYIEGDRKPKLVIQSVLSKLDRFKLEALITKYKEISINTSVSANKKYIQTMIYNACLETNLQILNQVFNS